MKSSKTSFLRNCISGWNVRSGLVELSILLSAKKDYLCDMVIVSCLFHLLVQGFETARDFNKRSN